MRVFVIVCQHERKVVENIELRSRLQGQQVTVTDIAKVKKNSQLCCWCGQFCSYVLVRSWVRVSLLLLKGLQLMLTKPSTSV